MTTTTTGTDWLGLPCAFTQPETTLGVGRTACDLGVLVNGHGTATAREATEMAVWIDDRALHVRARCVTAHMDRVRGLAAAKKAWSRDAWGDDALEVQIDAGATRREYLHVIISPSGDFVTLRGFNNRQVQGWHPAIAVAVTLEDDAWTVTLAVPFAEVGAAPAPGQAWGFNLMRVNPDEPSGYLQWAPTFGEALRPEYFGTLVFDGPAGDRAAELAAYARRAEERTAYFQRAINTLTPAQALAELGYPSWTAWDAYLATRSLRPLRWEGLISGAEGIVAPDRPLVMAMAASLCEHIAGWTVDAPPTDAFFSDRWEALGDAYLLTGDRKYVEAFEHAVAVHAALLPTAMARIDSPHRSMSVNTPYHDFQIIRAYLLAYIYLTMREAGLSEQTHATVLWTVLRACRFADYEIRQGYVYGNHQVYECSGLAMTTALFPEFPESAAWARTAEAGMAYHFAREIYPDGGYYERCTYHTVALGYPMQAVAVIRAAGAEARFPVLMGPKVLEPLERMHDWLLALLAPDGTHPPFGDFAAHPHLRYFNRASVIFNRPDLAWPLWQLAPGFLAEGMIPREPAYRSVALPSEFTVLRSGWGLDDFYLAAEHGPLGGQHSHVDTMGFAAYAHGRAVALDTGIGTTYDDPRYTGWFRGVRAHNVVAVDDAEPEKVAARVSCTAEDGVERLRMHSLAYRHAYGITHEREIVFLHGVGWLILDRLSAEGSLAGRQIDWLFHTPLPLTQEAPGVLHAPDAVGGLLVLAGRPETLGTPQFEQVPATVPVPEVRELRIVDAVRHFTDRIIQPITMLTWPHNPVNGSTTEFVTALIPYRGDRPAAQLVESVAGWTVELG